MDWSIILIIFLISTIAFILCRKAINDYMNDKCQITSWECQLCIIFGMPISVFGYMFVIGATLVNIVDCLW